MRKRCRHCQRDFVSRPRGLCWRCFYDPGVRERYPPKTPAADTRDGYGQRPPPPAPTEARPGSPAKLAVLCQRASKRWELWHPDDAR